MTVRPGDSILLYTSAERYLFVDAKPKATFRLKHARLGVEPLIGAAFGACFQVRGGRLVQCPRLSPHDDVKTASEDGAERESLEEEASSRKRDNRSINDDNRSQRVEASDIKRMRVDGASGEQIIETLIGGSETWKLKTDFSREKWLRRKEQKYLPWVRVLKPVAASVAAAYFSRVCASRQLLIRPDTVAQLISRADARQGDRIVVLDGTPGVVLGSLIERVAPLGTLFVPVTMASPSRFDALRRFNFDAEVVKKVVRQERLDELKLILRDDAADALVIVVSHLDPSSTLDALLPLLAPSSPFVVYADSTQPLVHAYQRLKAVGQAVALTISETWLRHFQVSPNRTHPDMTMSATGGYLLSGITTATDTLAAPADADTSALIARRDAETGTLIARPDAGTLIDRSDVDTGTRTAPGSPSAGDNHGDVHPECAVHAGESVTCSSGNEDTVGRPAVSQSI